VIPSTVDALYKSDSRRILATLIRLLGDFDLAEEALHDAFRAALEEWPRVGMPANPPAWLVSTGRFKAIDTMRRRKRFEPLDAVEHFRAEPVDESILEDDQLRLVFTCCHPALSNDAQVALTLREVCGLTTEAIAHAFLTLAPTIAQRIVRAKAKIRDARIPYEIPGRKELPARLDAVLRVVYLVFNEGYSASSGATQLRADLLGEALRLGRLLTELCPEPETLGLLALLQLTDARRAARTTTDGEIVLLEEQERSLWDRAQIDDGLALVERALSMGTPGPYAIQAAIAAVHSEARNAKATDWTQIVGLYDLMTKIDLSPVIALNRAVAVAMRDGAEAGLALIDKILLDGTLDEYHLAHAARADLCRRLGRGEEARVAYERALALTRQEPERRFLMRRLHELPCHDVKNRQ
jgi:RNA polymerase sigma-70 factor (ECF subfamily)